MDIIAYDLMIGHTPANSVSCDIRFSPTMNITQFIYQTVSLRGGTMILLGGGGGDHDNNVYNVYEMAWGLGGGAPRAQKLGGVR